MNTLLWMAVSIVYGFDSMEYLICEAFQHLMTERKKFTELSCFIYDRLANVVQQCFNKMKFYRKRKTENQEKEQLQLWVPGV